MSAAKTNGCAGQNADRTRTVAAPDSVDRTPRQSDLVSTPVSAAMLLGYARVSITDQHLERQRDALTAAGAQRIFEDTVSGAKRERPGLAQCVDVARPGDRIAVTELSRLGRRTSDLLALVDDLETRGIGLVVLGLALDTTTPTGRLIVSVLAACSQLERDLLRERTLDGLAAARKRGRVGGRPRSLTPEQVSLARELVVSGHSAVETARLLGGICSERTIRRVVAEASE